MLARPAPVFRLPGRLFRSVVPRTGGMETPIANQLCFLGTPALHTDGRLQPFGGPRRAIALLAFLVRHRDAAVARSAIAECFWPDDGDEPARAALRRHLYRALAALPPAPAGQPWVVADKVSLRWNVDAPIAVDVVHYEAALARGDRAAAAELYRGEYLAGFHFDWVFTERERLRQLHAANLAALIDERRRALAYTDAIDYANRLVALEPLREDVVRRLLSLRLAVGDRAGALHDFETFARRLREELDAEPMPETLALRDTIRSGDRSLVRATTRAANAYAFVGRDPELARLTNAWQAAARGDGGVALVSGEAGAGKSRLLAELAAGAEQTGAHVIIGTASPIETEPYQPLAEALRRALPLLGVNGLDAVTLAALATLVPDIAERVPGLPMLARLDPERERTRLHAAIGAAFERLAERRPLLVLIEDLQWAGRATCEVVESLARRARDLTLLVVVSIREGDPGESAAHLALRRAAPDHLLHLPLKPLDARAMRELVESIAPATTSEDVAKLTAASDGNALFLTELLRGDTRDIPPNLLGVVTARTSDLSADARAMLEVAAVAGVAFDAEIVRIAGNWPYAALYDGLDELFDRALLREGRERRGDLRFAHHLVHQIVYNAIDPFVRRRLHRRIAGTLERRLPDRPAIAASVAGHYEAAGLAQRAIPHLIAAVRHALSVFANDNAAEVATRALSLAVDERARYDLLDLRERARRRTGDFEGCMADCAALVELAQTLDDADALGDALCRSTQVHMQRTERAAEDRAITALAMHGAAMQSQRWQIEAVIARARFDANRSAYHEAHAALVEIEPKLAGSARTQALDYWIVRAFAAARLDASLGWAALERAADCAAGDPTAVVRVLRTRATLADNAGDVALLDDTASLLIEQYVEIGDLEGEAMAHKLLAVSAWYRADVAADRRHLARARHLFGRINKQNSLASTFVNSAVLAQHLGDFAGAARDYNRAEELARAVDSTEIVVLVGANRASLALFQEDFQRAAAFARDAVNAARDAGLTREEMAAREYLGVAERELGRCGDAVETLEDVLAWRRRHDPRAALEGAIELVPAYLAAGRIGDAVSLAGELVAALATGPLRVTFPAYAFSVAASAFAAAGDGTRAGALAAQARSAFTDFVSRLPDDHARAGYASLPIHRALLTGV